MQIQFYFLIVFIFFAVPKWMPYEVRILSEKTWTSCDLLWTMQFRWISTTVFFNALLWELFSKSVWYFMSQWTSDWAIQRKKKNLTDTRCCYSYFFQLHSRCAVCMYGIVSAKVYGYYIFDEGHVSLNGTVHSGDKHPKKV